ncbi:MAG: glycosyltransferase [Acidobacteriota bacterium]
MISIITPSNNRRWLPEAYESLKAQTLGDFEWIILLNGDASGHSIDINDFDSSIDVFDFARNDDRVRIIADAEGLRGIGALKRRCCELARGEILLELDHDDLLMPTALEMVHNCFEANLDIGMVYSNCCRVDEDWTPNIFGPQYGWAYREVEAFGHVVVETISPDPLPQNLSRIWYAPDHLRAWRRSEYDRVGGHDPSLQVGDDHDLICRFYLESKIGHISKPLYIYRIHGANNWLERNGEVQEQQWRNYEALKLRLAEKWARGLGLEMVDLSRPAYDRIRHFSFQDDSVGCIKAFDVLQGIKHPVRLFNEAYRMLAHGGFFFTLTPSTDGRGAFCDPTHKSFWNELSFRYYTDANFQRYIVNAECRFQVLRLRTFFPSEWHEANQLSYVQCDMVAHKDDSRRFHGALDI